MFEYFESVKSKVSDAIDSVSDENFIDDLKKFADDGATSVSSFFSEEKEMNGDAKPKEGDDMLGYDLSSDDEDAISDIPLIKKQYQRQRKTIEEDESADSVGEMSGIRTGETRPGMPGYASLNAYVNPDEVLKRRVTTSRKITEADLDKNNPLYRDMDQINNSEKYLEHRESVEEISPCSSLSSGYIRERIDSLTLSVHTCDESRRRSGPISSPNSPNLSKMLRRGLVNDDGILRPDHQRLLIARDKHAASQRRHVEMQPLKPLPFLDFKFSQSKEQTRNNHVQRYQG